jgi:hypothetical protein
MTASLAYVPEGAVVAHAHKLVPVVDVVRVLGRDVDVGVHAPRQPAPGNW